MERFNRYSESEEFARIPEQIKKVAIASYKAYKTWYIMAHNIGTGSGGGILDEQADFKIRKVLSDTLPQLTPFLPDRLLIREYNSSKLTLTVGSGPLSKLTNISFANVTYFLPKTNEIYSFTPAYHFLSKDPEHQAENYDPRHPSFIGFEQVRKENKSGAVVFYQTDFSRNSSKRLEDSQLAILLKEINNQISDKGKGISEELNDKLAKIREETEKLREIKRVYYGNLLQSVINQLKDAVVQCTIPSQSWRLLQSLFREYLFPRTIPLSQIYDQDKGQYLEEQRRYFSIRTGKIVTRFEELDLTEWTRKYNARYAIEGLIALIPNNTHKGILEGIWQSAAYDARVEIEKENPS